jgi:hypothetical protein
MKKQSSSETVSVPSRPKGRQAHTRIYDHRYQL